MTILNQSESETPSLIPVGPSIRAFRLRDSQFTCAVEIKFAFLALFTFTKSEFYVQKGKELSERDDFHWLIGEYAIKSL